MENQLHTQKTSNIKNSKFYIKENINYIAIGLMIIVNILLSVLQVEDGSIALAFPNTVIGWIMFISRIVLSTAVGVWILLFFRRQGIKTGHSEIKDLYNQYLEACRKNTKNKDPRSLKQYMVEKSTKDVITKSLILSFTSLVVGTLLISANLNSILSLIITTIMSIAFGIMNMIEAENFVIEELALWYKKEIELNKKENENEQLQGN